MPSLFAGAFPDEEQHDVMEGGIQIQAGTTVTGLGTLGCIGHTDDPDSKVVGLTCQHVFAFWSAQPTSPQVWQGEDRSKVMIYGTNTPGMSVRCSLRLVPTGAGTVRYLGTFDHITTNADTPATIASDLASQINALANPNASASSSTSFFDVGPELKIAPPEAGFNARLQCRADMVWASTTGTKVITFSGISAPGLLVTVNMTLVPMPTGDLQYLDIFQRSSGELSTALRVSANRGNLL